jgi:hypothetical protein
VPVCAAGRGGVRCAVGITFVGEASRSPRTWAKHHGKFTKTAQSAERMLCMLESNASQLQWLAMADGG